MPTSLPPNNHSTADRWATLVAMVVFGATTLLVWGNLLDLTLLGWDTYPMIAAARIDGIDDLLGAFTRELMDGRYPLGHYWRPVTHLTFSLDHALFGLDPLGYHITDLAILTGSALALFLLVKRWVGSTVADGSRAWIAGLAGIVGGLAWILHAAHFDVLTAPPRRADALAVFFTLCAVCAQLGVSSAGNRRAVWVGAFCTAALASKETGIVAAPLVLGLSWLQARGGLRDRSHTAFRRSWPAIVWIASALLLRTFVLGGLGGSEDSSLALHFASLPTLFATYMGLALLPPGTTNSAASLAAVLGVLATVVVVLVAIGRFAGLRPRGNAQLPTGASIAFIALWLVLLTLVTATSGIVQFWYALPFVACVSAAGGWMTGMSIEACLGSRIAARVSGACALVLVGAGLISNSRGAGLGDAARDHHEIGAETELFLEAFVQHIRDTEPGGDLPIEVPSEWVRIDDHGEIVRKILPIGPYSLEAYAELVLPDRRVFVVTPSAAAPREPGPDEVRVTATASTRILGP